MNKAEKLNKEVLSEIDKTVDFGEFVRHLRRCPLPEIAVLCSRKERYGQWLHTLIKIKKPKQVVEIGAAWGNSAIMMGMAMSKNSKFYSVDLGLIKPPWGNIDRYYPSLVKVPGNSLDLAIYPEGTKLEETDIWFIDSEHTARQFGQEIELYSTYFKKGAIVVCDDIHLNDMEVIWNKLPYDKCDNSYPCRPDSGFGVFVV